MNETIKTYLNEIVLTENYSQLLKDLLQVAAGSDNDEIYTIGSTPARTRLYQISISKYWSDIESMLHVYGLSANGWEFFEKNNKYTAFIFAKKQ